MDWDVEADVHYLHGPLASGEVAAFAANGSRTVPSAPRPPLSAKASLAQGVDDAVATGGGHFVGLPGSAGKALSSRPNMSVRTCIFMPCFLCLPE